MNGSEQAHTPAAAAAERLALTRLHLQQALGAAPGGRAGTPGAQNAHRAAAGSGAQPPSRLGTTGPSAGSPSSATPPGAQLLLATLRAWWARHPLHGAGRLALQAANAAARPVAQRHPLALLLAAAACGAALVWARPWRQLTPRGVMAALLPVFVPVLLPVVVPGVLRGLLASLLPLLMPTHAAQPLWTRLLRALLPSAPPPPAHAAPQAPASAAQTGARPETAARSQAGSKKA